MLVSMYPILLALVFHVIDFISGFIAAVKNNDVQSAKLRDGMFKKIGFLFCYLLAFLIDNYGSLIGFSITVSTVPILAAYGVLTEITSILENIQKINEDILPDKIKELLHITNEEV